MNNRDMPRVMKTKFPATVMVFDVVSSEGHMMPPHIFEVGLKVNTKVCLNVLKSVMIPWYNQVAGGRPWVGQLDSALAHKSKETQAWLQKECYDFVLFSQWEKGTIVLFVIELIIYTKMDLALNNLKRLRCHKTQPTKQTKWWKLCIRVKRCPS